MINNKNNKEELIRGYRSAAEGAITINCRIRAAGAGLTEGKDVSKELQERAQRPALGGDYNKDPPHPRPCTWHLMDPRNRKEARAAGE